MAATQGHSAPVSPTIAADVHIAPGAVLIGQVTVEEGCFIGPGAVLRGDIEPIRVLRGTNIQDNCIVHTEVGHPTVIGPDVSVGHGAVVHGATVMERALVGMNAVVLNGARVGVRAVVGALSLVPEGFLVPDRSLAVGAPCRIAREDDERIGEMAFQNTQRYHRYTRDHRDGRWGVVTGPL